MELGNHFQLSRDCKNFSSFSKDTFFLIKPLPISFNKIKLILLPTTFLSCFIKLKIFDTESEKDLESRIHSLEHYIYPKILSELQEGKIFIKDGEVLREEIVYKNGKEYFI